MGRKILAAIGVFLIIAMYSAIIWGVVAFLYWLFCLIIQIPFSFIMSSAIWTIVMLIIVLLGGLEK